MQTNPYLFEMLTFRIKFHHETLQLFMIYYFVKQCQNVLEYFCVHKTYLNSKKFIISTSPNKKEEISYDLTKEKLQNFPFLN